MHLHRHVVIFQANTQARRQSHTPKTKTDEIIFQKRVLLPRAFVCKISIRLKLTAYCRILLRDGDASL